MQVWALEGQPQTCYRYYEAGHQQIDCPRKKRFDSSSNERRTTWAESFQHDPWETSGYVMEKWTPMPDCRPESHNRSLCNDTLQSSRTFPKGMQSAGSSKTGTITIQGKVHWTTTLFWWTSRSQSNVNYHRGTTQSGRPGISPAYKEEPATDQQTGQMEVTPYHWLRGQTLFTGNTLINWQLQWWGYINRRNNHASTPEQHGSIEEIKKRNATNCADPESK